MQSHILIISNFIIFLDIIFLFAASKLVIFFIKFSLFIVFIYVFNVFKYLRLSELAFHAD